MLAGVCGGIAEAYDLDAQTVRAITVLMLIFTSAPVLIAYIAAAIILPLAPQDDVENSSVDLDWESDGLRVAYSAAIAPYAISWQKWAGTIVGGYCATIVLALMTYGIAIVGGSLLGVDLSVVAAPLAMVPASLMSMWPMVILGVLAGLVPRPYKLSVSHSALQIQRPLRQPRRIALAQLEHISADSQGVRLSLHDGEQLLLPSPTDDLALDMLLEQVRKGQERVLAFEGDLEAAEDERRALDRVIAQTKQSDTSPS